jgi:hypothetical protein
MEQRKFDELNRNLMGVRSFIIIFLLTILLVVCPFLCRSQANKDRLYKYWSSKRKYTYEATYIDSLGQVLTKEVISIHPTEEIWQADPKQTLADYSINYKKEDSLKYGQFPLNNKQRAWFRDYQEGVLEDSARLWMHPIRSNQYLLTEVAPFPEIRFPLQKDRSWDGTLWIYPAFGSFQGTVGYQYKEEAEEVRKYSFGNLTCWKISAIATHDRLGSSTAIFYFNVDFGITEMHYTFYNAQKMTFILTSPP